jgi:hypothetical protein
MVLVLDDPATVALAQAQGQAKVELLNTSALVRPETLPVRRDERHFLTRRNTHIRELELRRIGHPAEKQVPGLSIRIDTL